MNRLDCDIRLSEVRKQNTAGTMGNGPWRSAWEESKGPTTKRWNLSKNTFFSGLRKTSSAKAYYCEISELYRWRTILRGNSEKKLALIHWLWDRKAMCFSMNHYDVNVKKEQRFFRATKHQKIFCSILKKNIISSAPSKWESKSRWRKTWVPGTRKNNRRKGGDSSSGSQNSAVKWADVAVHPG